MSLFRFFHRERSDAELLNEIEAFLSEETADNEARGMSPDEARRQARIKLGNPQKVRESLWTQKLPVAPCRARLEICFSYVEPHAGIFDHRNCGHGFVPWRGHLPFHRCAFGAAAAAAFSRPRAAGDGVRTLPRKGNSATTRLRQPTSTTGVRRPTALKTWQSCACRVQPHRCAQRIAGVGWRRGRFLEPVFTTGSAAGTGPGFTEADDQRGSAVVMLTWSLFERRFAGDAKIVGGQIHLDGKPYTVVGVLPSWFTYPDTEIRLWVPYKADASPEMLQHHDWHGSQVVARLRPDVSLASAIAQVGAIQYQNHLQYLARSGG